MYEACKTAIEELKQLLDVLASNEVIAKVSRDQLERFFDPLKYLGISQAMVDDMLRISALKGRGVKNAAGVNGTLTQPADHGESETITA